MTGQRLSRHRVGRRDRRNHPGHADLARLHGHQLRRHRDQPGRATATQAKPRPVRHAPINDSRGHRLRHPAARRHLSPLRFSQSSNRQADILVGKITIPARLLTCSSWDSWRGGWRPEYAAMQLRLVQEAEHPTVGPSGKKTPWLLPLLLGARIKVAELAQTVVVYR